MIETLSALAMPLITALVGGVMLFGKRNYFDAFTKGATEGLHTALRLLPTLVGLMVAISMLVASGAVARVCDWLTPLANAIGLPADLLPLLLTRPFSGSASTAAYSALLDEVGPDSFTGLCASVILATSDTVVYFYMFPNFDLFFISH